MLQMRARSFALRDCFPDVLKGLISVEEALDLPAPNDRLPPARTTIDAAPEPPLTPAPAIETPPEPAAAPPASPAQLPRPRNFGPGYQLETKQGTTTFQSAETWLDCWARIVRGCKGAGALDKLRIARETNEPHIAAVAQFDPEPAATLKAELDRALAPPPPPG